MDNLMPQTLFLIPREIFEVSILGIDYDLMRAFVTVTVTLSQEFVLRRGLILNGVGNTENVDLHDLILLITRGITNDSAALALRYEHKPQVSVHTVDHLLYQLSDFPLSLTAQTLVAHVNEFSQITGEVEREVSHAFGRTYRASSLGIPIACSSS
jgi:hypothetical protein